MALLNSLLNNIFIVKIKAWSITGHASLFKYVSFFQLNLLLYNKTH